MARLTNRAFVRAVAGFAAFFAHRSLHSRAVVSVMPFGSSVPSQLVNLCSGHARLKALLWVVLPHLLHLCIRWQSFRLWPFGSSVPWQLLHLCSGHSAFVGRAAAFVAWSTFDAECHDAPHLLHTRNLQLADFCLCPGCLHSVQ